MKNRATRDQVAKLAGVSHMTVSRVFNNSGYVAQETKRKVLEAAAQLNYRRNIVASGLRSKKVMPLVLQFRHSSMAFLRGY